MLDAEQRRYERLGSDYFWFAGKRLLVWSLLRLYLGASPEGLRILDLGCGPGYAFGELKRWGRIVGIDPSRAALTYCLQHGDHAASLINGEADALPCRAGTFSLIVALDVFEHLEDDLVALRECQRVLRPGGWLVLTVPAFGWLRGDHDDLYFHKRRYRVSELKEKLEWAGFDNVKLTYCEAFFVGPLWIFRRLKRVFLGHNRPDDFIQPPAWLNRWLTRFIVSEASLLSRWNMPWGVSIIGIARKT